MSITLPFDLSTYVNPIEPISSTMDMYAVFDRFRSNKLHSFFPVIDELHQPIGIIREIELKDYSYGMFGRELIRKERVVSFIKACLCVEVSTPVEEVLLKLANNRPSEGILVTDHGVYVGVISNLSLLSIYEALRVRTQRQLSQVQKMEAIGTLAGGIAHDFNNILMPIIGYAELLKQMMDQEQRQLAGFTDQILLAANRARELVSQILAFSRQRVKERGPLHVAPIVKEVMKLLRSSLPSTIEIRTETNGEDDVAIADPTEIHQVLMNLCTNAAHAMNSKGGTLTVLVDIWEGKASGWTCGKELLERPYVHISVADTGYGIDSALLPRIFDPFFTTKKLGEGTGMGLSVVHGIVESSDGVVSVDSAPGEGSTFHVYLPASRRLEDHCLAAADAAIAINGRGIRVLFVDDEEMIVDLVSSAFEMMGFDITSLKSSVEALTRFEQSPQSFDIVITDQTMPEITGVMMARRMLELRPGMPIILATGYTELVTPEMALAAGLSDYVMKPIHFNDLARRVLSLVLPSLNTGKRDTRTLRTI